MSQTSNTDIDNTDLSGQAADAWAMAIGAWDDCVLDKQTSTPTTPTTLTTSHHISNDNLTSSPLPLTHKRSFHIEIASNGTMDDKETKPHSPIFTPLSAGEEFPTFFWNLPQRPLTDPVDPDLKPPTLFLEITPLPTFHLRLTARPQTFSMQESLISRGDFVILNENGEELYEVKDFYDTAIIENHVTYIAIECGTEQEIKLVVPFKWSMEEVKKAAMGDDEGNRGDEVMAG
jgi:hypothetical protein